MKSLRTVLYSAVRIILPLVMLLLGVNLAVAEDFSWSWEDGESPESAETDAGDIDEENILLNLDEPALDDEESVNKESTGEEQSSDSEYTGVNIDAYNELLRSNLDLRRQIAEVTQSEEKARQENELRGNEIRDMEGRLSILVSKIQDINKEKELSGADLDKVMQLESELAQAEEEKARFNDELEQLRRQLSALEQQSKYQPTSSVRPGSDLFEQVQKENVNLKKELREALEAKTKAVKEVTQAQELKQMLDYSKSVEKEQKKMIGELLKQIPAMEQELLSIKATASEKEMVLGATEKDLEETKRELEKRDYRLVKAEKMADLLEKTRKEVMRVSDVEKRNMHYNMGVVYAKEGRSKDAEVEYLNALRIDPSDADAHYNLAILYENEIKDIGKAIRHYKAYLKLRPHANDVDTVRLWLISLEAKK